MKQSYPSFVFSLCLLRVGHPQSSCLSQLEIRDQSGHAPRVGLAAADFEVAGGFGGRCRELWAGYSPDLNLACATTIRIGGAPPEAASLTCSPACHPGYHRAITYRTMRCGGIRGELGSGLGQRFLGAQTRASGLTYHASHELLQLF